MQSVIPPGDNVYCIGQSQGYRGLHVNFGVSFDHAIQKQRSALTSAFKPSKEQLKLLNQGADIVIQLLTQRHPPILVSVR